MTGNERWPYDETRRLESEEWLAERADDDPFVERKLAPGPMSRGPVMISRPGSGGPAVERDPLGEADPASVPRASWRSEIKGASGVNLVVGIWLSISPLVLAYRSADPVWTQVVVGGAVFALALLRVTSGAWKSWMSWANASLGTGIVIVAAWLADSVAARWNGIVSGGVVLVLAILSASATESAKSATKSPRADQPWSG